MNENFGILENFFSKEIIKNLRIKEYTKGEFLLTIDEHKILYILEGTVYLIRYHGDKKIIHPYFFKKHQFVGVNMYLQKDIKDWEIEAATDKVRVVVLEEKLLEEHVLNNTKLLRLILEKSADVLRQGMRGFFIRSSGGAKVFFAFLLINNSVDGKMYFLRYTDVADVLNISKSMLYKLTGELIDEGCIEKNRNCITILDEEKLKGYYEEYIYNK